MSMYEQDRYRYVTSQIDKHAERVNEAFALFVKLAVAIVGGFVWIATSAQSSGLRQRLAQLCPHALLLVAVVSSLLIVVYIRGKWIFRNLEADILVDLEIERPKFPGSCLAEITMVGVMILSTLAFYAIAYSFRFN